MIEVPSVAFVVEIRRRAPFADLRSSFIISLGNPFTQSYAPPPTKIRYLLDLFSRTE